MPHRRLSDIKERILSKWNTESSVGSIFRNMAVLASGTAVARAIAMVSMPVVTRIYTPEHMGVLSVFTAIVLMLAPLGTLLYHIALPLPDHDRLAFNLAAACGSLLLIFSALTAVIFLIFGRFIFESLSMEQLQPYWWLIPIGIAGAGSYQILSNWAIREKAFKPLAITQAWQPLVGAVLMIGLGLLGYKPFGLLIGGVFNKAGGVVFLLRAFRRSITANLKYITRRSMILLLWHYADFPKYRLPSQFLLRFSSKLPLLFFAWQFDAETTGHLGLAFLVVALPMSLFGQTTAKAFYAEIANIGPNKPEKIYKVTISLTKKLFLISIPFFLLLLFSAPWLFQTIFGPEWQQAGVFTSILAFYLSAQFVSSPFMNILNVFDKQDFFFLFNFFKITILILAFGFSYVFSLTPTNTVCVYSSVMFAYYFSLFWIVLRFCKCKMG